MNIQLHDTEYYENIELSKKEGISNQKCGFVITVGCQQNEADSEKIRGILSDMGYGQAESFESAEIIILNTCAIRELAEKKVFSMLGRFKAIKASKPELIIGVCGCMAAESGVIDKIKKSFPYVSFTLEPNRLHDLPRLINSAVIKGEKAFPLGKDTGDIVEGLPTIRAKGDKAWVSIMYGCNNFCTYCIVPYVRGRERSRDSHEVIEECRELVKNGVKEITLLGQNVNSYHSDITFSELIKQISDIEGDFLLKFMTSHPKDASDELISLFKKGNSKLAPYFHLPLQSGSDEILKAMNRRYDTERYLSLVEKLRETNPDIALSTDIIVGFPGETEEDFEKTMQILHKVKFDFVFAFVYSKRAGTPAEKMDNQIDDKIKSARITRLLCEQDEISIKKNEALLNSVVDVHVDYSEIRDGKTVYTGRTMSSKRVHFSSNENFIGENIKVKITRAAPYDLFGEAVRRD